MGKIAILGVEGSGKTVLMAALAEAYGTPREDGFYLRPENQQAFEFMHLVPYGLRREHRWPEATRIDSMKSLRWSMCYGQKVLGELEFMDYPGEIYRSAFGERSEEEIAGQATEIHTFLEHLFEAETLCVLMNLKDAEDPGHNRRDLESLWLTRSIFEFSEKLVQLRHRFLLFTQMDRYGAEFASAGSAKGLFRKHLPHVAAVYPDLPCFAISAVTGRDDGTPAAATSENLGGLENLMRVFVAFTPDGEAATETIRALNAARQSVSHALTHGQGEDRKSGVEALDRALRAITPGNAHLIAFLSPGLLDSLADLREQLTKAIADDAAEEKARKEVEVARKAAEAAKSRARELDAEHWVPDAWEKAREAWIGALSERNLDEQLVLFAQVVLHFDKVAEAAKAARAKAKEERLKQIKAAAEAADARKRAKNAQQRGHADAQCVESSSLPDAAKEKSRGLRRAMDEAFVAGDWPRVHKLASDLWEMAEEIHAKRRRANLFVLAAVVVVAFIFAGIYQHHAKERNKVTQAWSEADATKAFAIRENAESWARSEWMEAERAWKEAETAPQNENALSAIYEAKEKYRQAAKEAAARSSKAQQAATKALAARAKAKDSGSEKWVPDLWSEAEKAYGTAQKEDIASQAPHYANAETLYRKAAEGAAPMKEAMDKAVAARTAASRVDAKAGAEELWKSAESALQMAEEARDGSRLSKYAEAENLYRQAEKAAGAKIAMAENVRLARQKAEASRARAEANDAARWVAETWAKAEDSMSRVDGVSVMEKKAALYERMDKLYRELADTAHAKKTAQEKVEQHAAANVAIEMMADARKTAVEAGATKSMHAVKAAVDLLSQAQKAYKAQDWMNASTHALDAKEAFQTAAAMAEMHKRRKEAIDCGAGKHWPIVEEAEQSQQYTIIADSANDWSSAVQYAGEASRMYASASAISQNREAHAQEAGQPLFLKMPGGAVMAFRWIPAGSFWSESPNEPRKLVVLTNGFWMGEREVTQGQWESVMGGGLLTQARKAYPGTVAVSDHCGNLDDDIAMYFVNHDDAVEFCRIAGEKAAREIRLPTREEWEYACRAGTETALPNGRNLVIRGENNAPALDGIAWYGGNSSQGFEGRGVDTSSWPGKQYRGGLAMARKTGLKEPNSWGLHDCIGNVEEWCEDTDSPVICGGSWASPARLCRSASWHSMPSGQRDNKTGFRVLLLPDAKSDKSLVLSSAREAVEVARDEADGAKTLFPDEWKYAEAIRKKAQKAETSSMPSLYREAERFYKRLAREYRNVQDSNK